MIMHIVGNRPQFVKLAPISRNMRARGIKDMIIHTGQHYDENMSNIFFEELDIPEPVENLGIGSGSHAKMTGNAMIALEEVMIKYQPECVIVYGDTDSTLAAALAASKLCIPIIHIEAGIRSHIRENPEECNRIVVDHLSSILCTPDKISMENLIKENIQGRIEFTGDVMYDEFLYCINNNRDFNFDIDIEIDRQKYILLTWHRQENTGDINRVKNIIGFLEQLDMDIVFPIHPRTKNILKKYGLFDRLDNNGKIYIIEPVGYLEMVYLLKNCELLISDSGGASKEAFFSGKKCLYLLDLIVWPELVAEGIIKNVDVDNSVSVSEAFKFVKDSINLQQRVSHLECFGNGNAAEKIVDLIEKLNNGKGIKYERKTIEEN